MTNAAQEAWIATAMGRATDPDGVGGLQCVDAAKDYFEHIFGVGWKNGWPGAGNAKDMLYTFNPAYFDRTLNDAGDAGQIPQRGDIIIWAGTATSAGPGVNEYGHIAVVVDADSNGVDVIQQDGFLQVPMFAGRLAYTNYGTGPCSGWLRPKVSADTAVSPQSSNVTPIPTPQEDDLSYNQWPDADKNQLIHDLWAGRAGADLVFNRMLQRGEWPETILGSLEDRIIRQQVAPLRGEVAGLTELVRQLVSSGAKVDLSAVTAAAKAGVDDALKDGAEITADAVVDALAGRLTNG